MFFLFYFTFAKNYRVDKRKRKCKNDCSNYKSEISQNNLFFRNSCISELYEPEIIDIQRELIDSDKFTPNNKQYKYSDSTYLINKDECNFPINWRRQCILYGKNKDITNITFNDVYSFDGHFIDNFIELFNFNTINIKPSRFLHLKSFSKYQNIHFNIHVDHDFYLNSDQFPRLFNIINVDKSMCSITGKGNILFVNSHFMKDVRKFCNIDENINLKLVASFPAVYACVGQSNLDNCKEKINNASITENAEWIWLRNIKTCRAISSLKECYVVDEQINPVFSADNEITFRIVSNSIIQKFSDPIVFNKNGYRSLQAQNHSRNFTAFHLFYILFIPWIHLFAGSIYK